MKKFFKGLGKYLLGILIAIDQLGNAICGGDPDETISSRIGKKKLKNGGKLPWRRPDLVFIDWCLNLIDENHCIDAIEADRGHPVRYPD